MMKMMIFDPQKRITPAQALKHPYFEGFVMTAKAPSIPQPLADNSGKNFFNAQNEFTNKPGSKARIESRKGVISRKSNINKNSFYRSKAVGKLPEYLPNKPSVIGSRGGQGSPGYMNKQNSYGGVNKLPNLGSSGGA